MCSELSIGQWKRREPQPQTLCNKVPLRLPEGVLSVGKMHLTASRHKDGLGMNNHYLYVGCTKVDLARFILNTESIARMILGGS